MKVDTYSHSFKVSDVQDRYLGAIRRFCRTLIQYKMVNEDGQMKYKPDKVFATSDSFNTYYRFHINLLEEFKKSLEYNQVDMSGIEWVHHTCEITDDMLVEFEVKHIHEPREIQPQCIEHILKPGHNKIINLQPGKGKTLISKHCTHRLGVRTVAFMKGSFIERWVPDLEETFKFRSGEILVVRGSQDLSALMQMKLDGSLKAKFVLISTTTYVNFIKDMEDGTDAGLYPIKPEDFFQKMGFGFAILDEGHQAPHQIMKIFTYTHIPKFLTLSATIDTKDKFLDKMYAVMYPREERFGSDFYDPYISVTAIRYQLIRPRSIQYRGFGGAYNHTTFEASILKKNNKEERKNYFDMITWYAKDRFVDKMQKGQKLIIFCGTIKFCTLLVEHMKKKFPHLVISRYVSNDKMDVLYSSDIVVSTVLSAGTAVDIPNLRVNIMTTAIDSQQSNEQTLGRTRKLKDFPDVTPEFYYFVCTSIDKHVNYHLNKKNFFRGKVLSHSEEQSPFSV